ncbi:hypothetical protein Droror1_Dr00016856 [Drosera rotundifolia]
MSQTRANQPGQTHPNPSSQNGPKKHNPKSKEPQEKQKDKIVIFPLRHKAKTQFHSTSPPPSTRRRRQGRRRSPNLNAKKSESAMAAAAPSKPGLPPQELLDDLCSRFVLNVPEEDHQSFERMLFVIEYAHWFYEDISVEKNPSLKSLTLREFTTLLFNNCEVLKPYVPHVDNIFKDFNSYKSQVPVTGAIILDQTHERCLLVKGWKGTSWSFPRGKKGKAEEDHACAEREVLEETGFNVAELLNKDEYIERTFGQQRVRLYIVAGVAEDTFFAPRTKKEISEIAWHRLEDLQPENDDFISRGITGLKLYMVSPFLASLKTWISKHPPAMASNPDAPLRGLTVWKAKTSSSGSSLATTELQQMKPSISQIRPVDTLPGKSFRNFKLDVPRIVQPLRPSSASD